MNKEFLRYHYMLGFPAYSRNMIIDFFDNFNKLFATYRFLEQSKKSKIGIPIPSKSDLMHPKNTVVEIYERLDEKGGAEHVAQKLLVRCHHLNDSFDFSYVCSREGFIVSGWANSKSDIHRLISKENYNQI